MSKKYVSLEHSIRNVITESVGVGGTSQYQGNPSGFDARYSSRKGKHAASPSMGAQRNASLTKISQTGGSMRAEETFIDEKVSDDKDEQKKNKGNSNLDLIKKSLVKHEPFVAKMTNPQGLLHPPIAPPQPQMMIPPSPQQQAMQPRQAPLPSTTPGAIATPQMARAEGGSDKSGSGGDSSSVNGDQAQAGVDPTHPAHAAPHLSAAASIVQHLAQLLHHQSQTAAATPPQAGPGSQGQNPAPAVNEPQSTDKKNWRDERRTGKTQSEIPGMIQRDPGTHGPDNSGGTHTNPGEKQKGSMGNLLGLPLKPNSPGMPSFQPPEKQVDPKMFKRPNTPGGPKIDEKTPGMPSFQPPEAIAPPSFSKGPSGKAAAAPPTSDYQTPAGPPPTGGKMSQMGKPVPEKAPEKKVEKAPEEKKGKWQDEPGRRTGKTQGEQPDMIPRDKGTHGPDNPDPGGSHTNPGEKQKASLRHLFGLDQPLPRQGKTGTQSGPAAEKPSDYQTPAGPPPTGGKMSQMGKDEKAPEKKGRWRHAFDAITGKETPAERDQYNKERDAEDKAAKEKSPFAIPKGEPPKQGQSGTQSGPAPEKKNWRDEPGRRTGKTQGEQPDMIPRDKGKVPDGPGHTNPGEKKKGEIPSIFPKGGINRPEKTDAEKNQEPAGPPPKGGKLSQTKQTPDEFTGIKPATPWEALQGKETQAQRDLYNKRKDQEYKEKNPEGPPYAWVGDMIKKYGKAAGIVAALGLLHKLTGGGSSGSGGSGGGSEKERKAGYAPVHVHGHDEGWAIPTSQTMRMRRRMFASPSQHNEETEHDNTKERRKVGFIERKHKSGDSTKERRKVAYLERKPKKHNLRHRFSSKTLQGRETIAGMDEERINTIMREAISDAKAKRKKTESGYSKTKVDTKPKLNPEPLDTLRGP